MFRDRNDAALQLANALQKYRGQNPLVLGIPRGGAVIGAVLARELKGDLDVILTRKLRTPGRPELAMGSIDENGDVYLNESIMGILQISDEFIAEEKRRQLDVIHARARSYRCIYPKIPLEGRTIIITDDGTATGATMKVAIRVARAAEPERLVVGLPVGPHDSVAGLKQDVDEMVCLRTPPDFEAVGQFYESFDQVEDEEVEKILLDFARRRA